MKIVGIIQARMGSTRLPGKVMLELYGQSVLTHVIERCRAIPSLTEVIVATSIKPEDDRIASEVSKLGVNCHRGSEEDVLERYYLAAVDSKADVIVRITSDCPLLDPGISDEVIRHFIGCGQLDYASNTLIRSFPRGLDTEVFSFSALEQAYLMAKEPHEREHVTPFLYLNPGMFRIDTVTNHQLSAYSHYRWTLDTPEDWAFIQSVYQKLYQPGHLFTSEQILALLHEQPQLLSLNAHIEQKKF